MSEESFFVEPVDTIWLRGGRPFSAGEASLDTTIFPPTPWTWQGMVRSRILEHHFGPRLTSVPRPEIEEQIGPPDRLLPGWILRGPLPAQCGPRGEIEVWVPWPRFLSQPDGERRPRRSSSLEPAGLVASSHQAHAPLLTFDPEVKPSEAGWISASNLVWALFGRGRWDPQGATEPGPKRAQGGSDLPPFVHEEWRTGLKVDSDTGRAEEHMLYTAVHHRFAPRTGLWGSLRGASRGAVSALREGPAALGHLGRLVNLAPAALPHDFAEILDGRFGAPLPATTVLDIRVVLLTPALARQGGQPPFTLPQGAEVLGQQAAEGPEIGGFDRRGAGGGRPMRTTWAAGSCWWVRLPAAPADEQARRIRVLLGTDPSSPMDDLERFGFGMRVAAPFNPTTGDPAAS